jgi:hypothetical protein
LKEVGEGLVDPHSTNFEFDWQLYHQWIFTVINMIGIVLSSEF